MKFRLFLAAAAVSISVFSVSGQEKKPGVDTLNWMTGCWEMNNKGRITTERWSKATSNLILGTSQTVKDGKSVAFEYLRIMDNGQGMVYVAKPSSAKEETSFMALKTGDKEVVFENLKHDFPQRIIYKLTKADALSARIEGTGADGKINGMDFPMTKVSCDQ